MMSSFPKLARPTWQRLVAPTLLIILLLLGVLLYQGYGLSWDEFSYHYNGSVNISFMVEFLLPSAWQHRLLPADPLLHPTAPWPSYDHGAIFEIPAAALGGLLYPGDPHGYYILRHLMIFVVFVGGVVALYKLARIRYPQAQWLPLLCAAMLVLSPRFFAEAFYNGQDIVFMAAFTLAMLTLVRLVQWPTVGKAVVHGLATGLAMDVRPGGLVFLVAFTLLALATQPWAPPAAGQPLVTASAAKRLKLFSLYAGVALLVTVVGWPYLWAAPVARLLDALNTSRHYPWPGTVRYFGQQVPASRLPWHYLPVWIGITTPLPYLGLLLLGIANEVRTLIRRGAAALRQSGDWLDLLFAGWLLGPLALVIIDKSVVYDGWRHVYFIYPALLLLTLRGLQVLTRTWQASEPPVSAGLRWLAGLVLVLFALETGRTGWFIAQAYPNQQVYFSFLPNSTAERLFERDYWGASYRYGLEWLLRHDPAPVITVTGPQQSIIYVNWTILTPAQRQRIKIVDDGSQARYYLTAYRWDRAPYPQDLGPEVLAYRPGGGIKALSIFRRDFLSRPLPPKPIGHVP